MLEYIPKPDLVNITKKNSLGSFKTDKQRSKTSKSAKILPNILKSLAEDKDPVNKRIFDCLDGHLQIDNDEINEGIFFSFFTVKRIIFYNEKENKKTKNVVARSTFSNKKTLEFNQV